MKLYRIEVWNVEGSTCWLMYLTEQQHGFLIHLATIMDRLYKDSCSPSMKILAEEEMTPEQHYVSELTTEDVQMEYRSG